MMVAKISPELEADLAAMNTPSLRAALGLTNGVVADEPEPAAPKRKQWPDPLDSAAFHGPAGKFVRIVEPHSEADPAALLIQFQVAIGNIIGRHAYRTAEGARHYTNLNAVIVGDTGHARKGSAWARVLQPLRLLAPDWIEERVQTGLSSGEGLIHAVRDPLPNDRDDEATSDPGIIDKRLMVVEQEFMSVLKVCARAGNTLSPTIRSAWDSGSLQTMTKNSGVKATGAHISIIGHITREELARGLDSTEAANGAANRILWICARRSKLLPRGGALKDSDFAPLISQLEAVLRFCAIQRELGFSDEAWAAWDKVYPALSAGRPGLLGAVLGRAEAQTLRLALLYAALDSSDTVELVHLQAALAVWAYAEESAEVIFGDRLGDPDADAILEALRANREGFNRTQINELFNRNLSAARIGQALESLLKGGLATMESKPSRGRPIELWRAK